MWTSKLFLLILFCGAVVGQAVNASGQKDTQMSSNGGEPDSGEEDSKDTKAVKVGRGANVYMIQQVENRRKDSVNNEGNTDSKVTSVDERHNHGGHGHGGGHGHVRRYEEDISGEDHGGRRTYVYQRPRTHRRRYIRRRRPHYVESRRYVSSEGDSDETGDSGSVEVVYNRGGRGGDDGADDSGRGRGDMGAGGRGRGRGRGDVGAGGRDRDDMGGGGRGDADAGGRGDTGVGARVDTDDDDEDDSKAKSTKPTKDASGIFDLVKTATSFRT